MPSKTTILESWFKKGQIGDLVTKRQRSSYHQLQKNNETRRCAIACSDISPCSSFLVGKSRHVKRTSNILSISFIQHIQFWFIYQAVLETMEEYKEYLESCH